MDKLLPIQLNKCFGKEWKMADGAANEFSQLFFNLLNNAKDAAVEKKIEPPRIAIIGNREGEKIRLWVSDKGKGIGLYMAKTIVEEDRNGELLGVNSQDRALFTIVLNSFSADERER